ncbi:hypothetical protein C8J57DRAFT_1617999 [Mycena rebaudengoi]|nr:hypothetical protein C8J57DRAFT_1617999 [Mycena rebaudengoi]
MMSTRALGLGPPLRKTLFSCSGTQHSHPLDIRQTILKKQRLLRPSSPHFTTYQPQLTWIASITTVADFLYPSTPPSVLFSPHPRHPLQLRGACHSVHSFVSLSRLSSLLSPLHSSTPSTASSASGLRCLAIYPVLSRSLNSPPLSTPFLPSLPILFPPHSHSFSATASTASSASRHLVLSLPIYPSTPFLPSSSVTPRLSPSPPLFRRPRHRHRVYDARLVSPLLPSPIYTSVPSHPPPPSPFPAPRSSCSCRHTSYSGMLAATRARATPWHCGVLASTPIVATLGLGSWIFCARQPRRRGCRAEVVGARCIVVFLRGEYYVSAACRPHFGLGGARRASTRPAYIAEVSTPFPPLPLLASSCSPARDQR